MPEEVNRVVADALSDVLFTTCREAARQPAGRRAAGGAHPLRRQPDDRLAAALRWRGADGARCSTTSGCAAGLRAVHAAPAVERRSRRACSRSSSTRWRRSPPTLPVVLPLHPRTRARIEAFGLGERIASLAGPPARCSAARPRRDRAALLPRDAAGDAGRVASCSPTRAASRKRPPRSAFRA